jgi:4-diphosphocytidyl-2-C-methyl-D-erythritol kinase
LFFNTQGFLKSLKKIDYFKKKHRLNFLLVYPNIKSSTKYVYSRVKSYTPKSSYNFNKINNKKNFIKLLMSVNNDLELIVENKHPIIRKLIGEISQKKGCYFSRMTGSGSVCYGLFKNERTAKAALSKIKSKYSKFWFSVAKTI